MTEKIYEVTKILRLSDIGIDLTTGINILETKKEFEKEFLKEMECYPEVEIVLRWAELEASDYSDLPDDLRYEFEDDSEFVANRIFSAGNFWQYNEVS